MAGRLVVSTASFPYGAAAFAIYTRQAEITIAQAVTSPVLELNGETFHGEVEIIRILAKAAGMDEETEAFFSLAQSVTNSPSFDQTVSVLDSIDHHLTFRTFLIGHNISAADWMRWGSFKGLSSYFHGVCWL